MCVIVLVREKKSTRGDHIGRHEACIEYISEKPWRAALDDRTS